MKNRKLLVSILMVIGILSITIGTTVAFFNYTRTGNANTVSVGRINFVTRQTKTISLTNLFPIDPTNSEEMSDATKVGTVEIEIEGDTDYSNGVEYLVSSENTHITTSTGKIVPISLDVTATNLGTSSNNYFTAREEKNATIYKRLVGDTIVGDQMLLVGYIKPNTTTGTAEGINGKLTIKAYLDKNKILISDTYDGTESDNMGTPNEVARGKTVLTTTEWNALQNSGVSFQIKVEANEGIWVKGSLEEIMKVQNLNNNNQPIMDNVQSEFVTASTGINFGAVSSNTNGKGIYMRAGTENDSYPILYYRGDVNDNNVVFNNKCWKAVRTTDTGGVKLIYSGEPASLYQYNNYNQSFYQNVESPINSLSSFIYDSSDNTWNKTITDGNGAEISFVVPAGDNYTLTLTGTTGSTTGGGVYFYKNNSSVKNTSNGGGAALSLTHSYGTLTANDIIKVTYQGSATEESPITLKIKMEQNGVALSQNSYSIFGVSFMFDSNVKEWSKRVLKNETVNIKFSVASNGNYALNYTNPNLGPFYITKNGTIIAQGSGTTEPQTLFLENVVTSDIFSVEYTPYSDGNTDVKFSFSERETVTGCNSNGVASGINLVINGSNTVNFKFNNYSNSLAYNGYMYGTVYEVKKTDYEYDENIIPYNSIFGEGFIYQNGKYKLINTVSRYNATHHYTCGLTSADGTCEIIKYYGSFGYYSSSVHFGRFIELSGGESVEDAMEKMQINTNSSNAKTQIDAWYTSNMNTVTNKLEDTVWCNDRSISNKAGWDPNGNGTGDSLYYSPYNRTYNTNNPSLECANKNDAFTVSNGVGNQKLTYPVALLTSDEIVLAGGAFGYASDSYLKSGERDWSLSPGYFDSGNANEFYVDDSGGVSSYIVSNSGGLRPSISIKPGLPVTKGTGTVTDPYVVE